MANPGERSQSWPLPARPGAWRDDILDAALKVIAERGYERARFADVASVAGTSVGNLQYLFGSREALLIEAFRHDVERDLEHLERLTAGADDPWQCLCHLVDVTVTEGGELRSSRAVWLEFWRAAARDARLAEVAAAVYEAWRRPFRRLVEAGIEAGRFRPVEDVERIIDVLFATIDGLTLPVLLGLSTARAEFVRLVTAWLATQLGATDVDRPEGAR